jgi:hypothetical protein
LQTKDRYGEILLEADGVADFKTGSFLGGEGFIFMIARKHPSGGRECDAKCPIAIYIRSAQDRARRGEGSIGMNSPSIVVIFGTQVN